MRKAPSLSLQVITLVTVAVVVSVGIFTAAAVWQGSRAISDAERAEHQATTELAALAVQEALRGSEDTLQAVASLLEDTELYPPDEEALRRRFSPLVPAIFEQVHIYDERGVIFSLPPRSEPVQPTGDEGLVVADGRVAWHIKPAFRDESLRVVGTIPEAVLIDVLFRFQRDARELALVDQDGNVLQDTLQAHDLSVFSSAVGSPSQTQQPVEGTPLSVIVLNPLGTPTIQRQAVAVAVATAGVVIMAGVGVGTVMSRRVTAPVEEVAQVARRLQKGDFKARVEPAGPPEIAELGRDINAMAEVVARDRMSMLQLQEELTRKVTARTRELEERQTQMEQFFYGVAHDIKGPAIGIASILQLLEESLSKFDSRQQMLLEQGQASAQQLRRLVEDLLQFAAAERVELEVRPVELRDFVRTSLAAVLAFAEERNVRVVNHSERAVVEVDPAVLQRVVQNLVRNAILHMPEDRGVVRVTAAIEGQDLRISVQDNGAGIPSEVAQRMFTPFVRGSNDNRGSGIGLSIVRKLVEAHGGTIECFSQKGRGTRFEIFVPDVLSRRQGQRVATLAA